MQEVLSSGARYLPTDWVQEEKELGTSHARVSVSCKGICLCKRPHLMQEVLSPARGSVPCKGFYVQLLQEYLSCKGFCLHFMQVVLSLEWSHARVSVYARGSTHLMQEYLSCKSIHLLQEYLSCKGICLMQGDLSCKWSHLMQEVLSHARGSVSCKGFCLQSSS